MNYIALCEFAHARSMFEVPHERRRIQEVDGSNAKKTHLPV